MKIYKANDELINVFLNHGFIEETSRSYPKHAQLLADKGVYDPNSIKRVLVRKRNKNYIYFDYINIKVIHSNSPHQIHSLSLSEQELRSILTYFSLSNQDRLYLNKNTRYKMTELHLFYYDSTKETNSKLSAPQKRIIQVFESVNI